MSEEITTQEATEAQKDTMILSATGTPYKSEARAWEALKKKELNREVYGVCRSGAGWAIDKLCHIFSRLSEGESQRAAKNASVTQKTQKYVEIKLAGKSHPNEYTKVPVGSNGNFYWLERGEAVIIPMSHKGVLEDAIQKEFAESEDPEIPFQQTGVVCRYPFVVLREDVPEKEFMAQVAEMRKRTKAAMDERLNRRHG